MALKHPSIKEFMKNSELSSATLATEDAINRISKNDNKVCYSFKDVKKVAEMGAIEKVMISSKVFELSDEDQVISLLDEIEKFSGQIYLLDSSTEAGKQIDSVGGIIASLRYPVYNVDWIIQLRYESLTLSNSKSIISGISYPCRSEIKSRNLEILELVVLKITRNSLEDSIEFFQE